MGGACQNSPGILSMSPATFLSFLYVIYVCMNIKSYVYQAKEAIKEAERCDPDSIFTQFSVYKIAVQENNVEKGI